MQGSLRVQGLSLGQISELLPFVVLQKRQQAIQGLLAGAVKNQYASTLNLQSAEDEQLYVVAVGEDLLMRLK